MLSANATLMSVLITPPDAAISFGKTRSAFEPAGTGVIGSLSVQPAAPPMDNARKNAERTERQGKRNVVMVFSIQGR
jgi:hypothetical protein